MEVASIDEARQLAIDRLTLEYEKALAASHDSYWQHGRGNVKDWVARAFYAAIDQVRRTPPTSVESPQVYLSRISGLVRELRGSGPDADDEAWFDSAVDEAAMIITSA